MDYEVISDFVSEIPFIDSFKISKKRHDMMALQLVDPAESILPDLGMIQLFNAETGLKTWVNSSSKKVRQQVEDNYKSFEAKLHNSFNRNGVNHAKFITSEDFIPSLIKMFQSRK